MYIEDIINIFDNNDTNMYGGTDRDNNVVKNHTVFKKTKVLAYDMIKNNGEKGMNTLLIPLPNSNTITVGVFIKAGSRQEDKTTSYGIAHFLEHMTFKGTVSRTSEKLMLELDSIGAQYNAMTGHEFTLYYISGNPIDIKILLDIIVDLYLHPTYPDNDIEKERNVVLEELRMNEDQNHKVLTKNIFNELFSDYIPDLARPIIGYKDTIKNLTRKNIMNYRKMNYKETNCLLCVSGNFEKDIVIKKIEELFCAKLNNVKLSPDMFKENIDNNKKIKSLLTLKKNMKKHINVDKNINQNIIYLVFNSYNTYNSNNVILDLLTDILSNGFSSKLFDLLRNKMGVSYYNNSYNRNLKDTGHFIISVGVDGKSVLKTIKGILNELAKLVENGITEEELQKAKKQNETSLLFQFKDPYEYLMYYGMNYLTKYPLYNLTDIMNNIEEVTLDQINNTTKEIFKKSNLFIATLGNISSDESNQIIKLIDNFDPLHM
jgi:predicted Zn-dependent peptidase